MRLWLVQHGEAKSEREDPQCSLTVRGERDVMRVAQFLDRARVEVGEIYCSDKRPAQQTASILSRRLRPTRGVRVDKQLGPGVEPVARVLATESEAIMVVGYLPFLERLAARLLTGDPDSPAVRFEMASVLYLERDDRRWSLVWMVTPDLVRGKERD